MTHPLNETALAAAAKAKWDQYRAVDGKNRVAWEDAHPEMVKNPLIEEITPIIQAYKAALSHRPTVTEEMIEKVANAMRRDACDYPRIQAAWKDLTSETRRYWKVIAKAAIAAMQDYVPGSVQSDEEAHRARASAPAGASSLQQDDACIAESGDAKPVPSGNDALVAKLEDLVTPMNTELERNIMAKAIAIVKQHHDKSSNYVLVKPADIDALVENAKQRQAPGRKVSLAKAEQVYDKGRCEYLKAHLNVASETQKHRAGILAVLQSCREQGMKMEVEE